jgi:hypothetical protein
LQIYSITGFPGWRTYCKALIFIGNGFDALHFLTRATARRANPKSASANGLQNLTKKSYRPLPF